MRLFDVDVIIVEPGFYRTALVDPEAIETMMNALWSRANQRTRLEYGEHFYKKSTECAIKLLAVTSSPHTEWVVNAYYHAVTARFPQRRYQVGYDSNFIYVPFSFLPAMLQDGVVWLIRFLMRLPCPAAIEQHLNKPKDHVEEIGTRLIHAA